MSYLLTVLASACLAFDMVIIHALCLADVYEIMPFLGYAGMILLITTTLTPMFCVMVLTIYARR